MTDTTVFERVIWRLHADKLMLIHDNNVHTAMLGFQMVANWFNQSPPSSLDIEYAIQSIEDGLAPLQVQLPATAMYYSDDAMLVDLYKRLGISEPRLTREQLEADFELVVQNLNRPMAMASMDLNKSAIAYELILREAMHHLDIAVLQRGI